MPRSTLVVSLRQRARRAWCRFVGIVEEDPAGAIQPPPGVRFAFEGIRDGQLTGWVWDVTHRCEPVDIRLEIEGEAPLLGAAGVFRDDLDRNHIGNGAHGFSIAPPAHLAGETRLVTLCLADGRALSRQRLTFDGPRQADQGHRQPS